MSLSDEKQFLLIIAQTHFFLNIFFINQAIRKLIFERQLQLQ